MLEVPPLIELKELSKSYTFTIYAKYELNSPAGSIKDRTALHIINDLLRHEIINKNSIIIESSSGNMAVALAMVCKKHQLPFIAVVDSLTLKVNIDIIKVYGGDVIIIDKPDPDSGTLLGARLKKISEMLAKNKNYYWINQYDNQFNIDAHRLTMQEIANDLGEKIDYLFSAVSTCGTIMGCSHYIHESNLKTKVIAVDAIGSVIFDTLPSKRLIPGHGAGVIPQNLDKTFIDKVVHVSDEDCVHGCLELLEKESIFAGGSSGAVLSAVKKYSHNIEKGATVVVILPDGGHRYIETIYSEVWRKQYLKF